VLSEKGRREGEGIKRREGRREGGREGGREGRKEGRRYLEAKAGEGFACPGIEGTERDRLGQTFEGALPGKGGREGGREGLV